MANAVSHPALGMTWSGFGALLVVVGAVLVIFDVNALIGSTWAGTRPEPRDRLLVAGSKVGALSAAIGAIILAADAGVSVLALVVVLIVVAVSIFVGMASPLRKHLTLVYEQEGRPPPSWWWCLSHPLWRSHS
jgi:hypothetical protein